MITLFKNWQLPGSPGERLQGFICSRLGLNEIWDADDARRSVENTGEMLARLVEVLAEKGVLTEEELRRVLDSGPKEVITIIGLPQI